MTQQQDALSRRIDGLADALLSERNRLIGERVALMALRGVVGGVLFGFVVPSTAGEFQARADSLLALIEAVETHVGAVLPRLEARMRGGDIAAGERAVSSSVRILAMLGQTHALSDLVEDSRQLLRDMRDDVVPAVGGAFVVAALAFGGYLWLTRR